MKVKLNSRSDWHAWFAWFPVRTDGGMLIWLEFVQRRWDANRNFNVIDPYDPGDFDGGYSEEHRHACEVRTLLGWGADKRRAFLELVAKKRGQEVANKLRGDVYRAWIVKKAAEIGPLDADERERRLWKIERGAGMLKRKDVEAAIAANDNQADLFGTTER